MIFLKELNKHQKNYSTIEKECLALVLALQHFDVYVSSSYVPLVVFTDHNPLTFLSKIKMVFVTSKLQLGNQEQKLKI